MKTRRQVLAGLLTAMPILNAARPSGPVIDTHVHLFAVDRNRFPFHTGAPYAPEPQTVETYVQFAKSAGIDHAVIVHPEPYQDDHRYLEYCFAREPSPMFFKGTCLFDPIAKETPDRIAALMKRNPGRIVALRVHEVRKPGEPARSTGSIAERDMHSAAMKTTWERVQEMGLAIQMHLLPFYAAQVGELAAKFPKVPVILDHLARGGLGTSAEYGRVLELAKLPQVIMKYSGANYSSKEKYPFRDVKPLVREAFEAFGADRMIWGDLGYDRKYFEEQASMLDLMFDFASEGDREKIRGGNALRVFGWSV